MCHHLSNNRSIPASGAFHGGKTGFFIEAVHQLQQRLSGLSSLLPQDFHAHQDDILAFFRFIREGHLGLIQCMENIAWSYFEIADRYRLQVPNSKVPTGTQLLENHWEE